MPEEPWYPQLHLREYLVAISYECAQLRGGVIGYQAALPESLAAPLDGARNALQLCSDRCAEAAADERPWLT